MYLLRMAQNTPVWRSVTHMVAVIQHASSTGPSGDATPSSCKLRGSRWRPKLWSGLPSERTSGLCLSTYTTLIFTFPWHGLYGITPDSWWTVECTDLCASRSAWLPSLGNLPSCCDQWFSFFGLKISSSMSIGKTYSGRHPYKPDCISNSVAHYHRANSQQWSNVHFVDWFLMILHKKAWFKIVWSFTIWI